MNYSAFLLSQEVKYSRNFETVKKNVPLAIINNHPGHFFLLRYNRLAHDMIVERRSKSDGAILRFSPLKLDSVNANWFDYEQLDYLFFEQDNNVYFVFEKALNSKKWLYLKITDSLGKTSGFIELCAMEREKFVSGLEMSFSLTTDNKILVVCGYLYPQQNVLKTVILYDPVKQERIWTKKLSPENTETGYSAAHQTNSRHDLFYVSVKPRVVGYNQQYYRYRYVETPVYVYDTLRICALPEGHDSLIKKDLDAHHLSSLYSIRLLPVNGGIMASVHFAHAGDAKDPAVYFLNQKFTAGLDSSVFAFVSPLSAKLSESLSFYDGTENNSVASKNYSPLGMISRQNSIWQLSERKDENYYKEMILWKTDTGSGMVTAQHIVPRKLFFFRYQTHFRHIGEAAFQVCGADFYTIVLENGANAALNPEEFHYHRFAKQNALGNAALVAYCLGEDGKFSKKLLLRNGSFESVPLPYQSNRCDYIIYQSRGKLERFAILQLNP